LKYATSYRSFSVERGLFDCEAGRGCARVDIDAALACAAVAVDAFATPRMAGVRVGVATAAL